MNAAPAKNGFSLGADIFWKNLSQPCHWKPYFIYNNNGDFCDDKSCCLFLGKELSIWDELAGEARLFITEEFHIGPFLISKFHTLIQYMLRDVTSMHQGCCYTAYNSQYSNAVFFQSSIFQLSIFQRFLYFNGRIFQRSYIYIFYMRGRVDIFFIWIRIQIQIQQKVSDSYRKLTLRYYVAWIWIPIQQKVPDSFGFGSATRGALSEKNGDCSLIILILLNVFLTL
jgi:hypothetical protein